MPTSERPAVVVKRYYKRKSRARQLIPALGVGIAVGAVAWYLARLFLERTELTEKRVTAAARE